MRVRRQKWNLVFPDLINVLDYDKRLTHRFSIMDENRDFLVNRVHLREEWALVLQVLFFVLIKEHPFQQVQS